MYEECKGPLKHAWFDYNPPTNTLTPRILSQWGRITMRCERCTSTRHDGITEEGYLVTRDYWHPADYKDPPDGKPTYEELRVFLVKRTRRKGVKKT